MSRLSRRLARKHRAVSNDPPAQAGDTTTAKLRAAVRGLRQTARGDPATMEIVNEAQRLIDSGWTERRGGGERTKPAPLHETMRPYAAQWKKPPPEWGEQ